MDGRAVWLAVFVVLAALTAGCMSGSNDADRAANPSVRTFGGASSGRSVEGENATSMPANESVLFEGRMDAMVLHSAGTLADHATFSQWHPLASLSAELSWTSPGNVEDLDVALVAPGRNGEYYLAQFVDVEGWFVNRAGVHGLPDSPATITLTREELGGFDLCDPCEWSVWALAKGGAVDVSFKVRVDLVYDVDAQTVEDD